MPLRLVHFSDLENVYDDPERAARLAGTLNALDDDDALLLGSGDNTSPGVLALVTRGEQCLDLFNAVAPAADTFGNHDFDYGKARTLELVERSPQVWLATNVRHVDGSRFGESVGVERTRVFKVDGSRVGVFGVTSPDTAEINPAATGLRFTDPVAAAEDAVAALQNHVDHVVALSHLGAGDEELAATVDVDVVLGGHTHSERVARVDGTVLTRPGANGEVVFEVSLPDRDITRHETRDGPVHEDVHDSLRERKAAAGLDEVVARVDEPIERTEATCFRGESKIGNFVADAYRWRADADVGLQNSGGIREGPPLAGVVTVGDLVSVVPFKGHLVLAEVPGNRLWSTFEQAAGHVDFGEPHWWHAHVSGARLEYDHATDELVDARVCGEPLDPARTYQVASAEYVVANRVEFPALQAEDVVERFEIQHEVLRAYAGEMGIDPSVEGRIVRLNSSTQK